MSRRGAVSQLAAPVSRVSAVSGRQIAAHTHRRPFARLQPTGTHIAPRRALPPTVSDLVAGQAACLSARRARRRSSRGNHSSGSGTCTAPRATYASQSVGQRTSSSVEPQTRWPCGVNCMTVFLFPPDAMIILNCLN